MIATLIFDTALIAVSAAGGAYAVKANPFASHAVDDITAGFQRLHARLEAAVNHHSDQADKHRDDAMLSEAAAVKAQSEAVRAAQTADKVGALIA